MRIPSTIEAALCLAACNQTTGQQFEAAAARDIKIGSDKATVQRLIGEPQQRTALANGEETWVYDFSKVQSDAGGRAAAGTAIWYGGALATSFIPGASLAMIPATLGAVAVNSKSNTELDKQTLTIVFKKNIVTACKLQSLKMTTEMSVYPLGPGSTNSKTSNTEINCADIVKSNPPILAQGPTAPRGD